MILFRSLLLAGILMGTAVVAVADSGGGPPARSFAHYEGNCASAGCHNSYPVEYDTIAFHFDSIPRFRSEGDTLDLSLRLSWAGQSRWGFQVAVLDSLSAPAGDLLISDSARTQSLVGSDGRQYISHTSDGTDWGSIDSSSGWSFRWASSSTPTSRARLFAAGVAANGDGTAEGDRVLVTTALVVFGAGCPDMLPGDVNLTGSVTAADVIYLINFVFKGLESPLPCKANGDVNCSGSVTSADIIYLVGHIFKGASGPCDICNDSPIGGTCW